MKKNEIKQQTEQYLRGAMTEEEQDELIRLMEADIDLDSWFGGQINQAENNIPWETKQRILDQILEKPVAQEKVQLTHEEKSGSKGTLFPGWKQAVAACVGLIIAIGIGIGGFLFGNSQTADMPMGAVVVNTHVGERSTITLPDGTAVQMNALSQIRFSYKNGQRLVTLDGEAFFEVAKDAEHPFIVESDGVSVECLGTAFDVRAYPDETQMQIVLQEGKVRVSSTAAQMTMEPNTRVLIDRHTLTMSKQPVLAEQYTCWTRGEVRYNDQTLEDIAADLARSYHVSLVITSDELKHERFTGYLGQCSLRNVLDLLAITSDLNYYFDKDTIYVYAKK